MTGRGLSRAVHPKAEPDAPRGVAALGHGPGVICCQMDRSTGLPGKLSFGGTVSGPMERLGEGR